MSGRRPAAVPRAAAVPARALPEDAAPPDPEPPDPVPPSPGQARALIRTQLRIALGTCAVVMAVVTGLPVLLAAVPAVASARVRDVPLWWLVLALGVQPLWIAVSRWQLRRAEQAEHALVRPVERP